MPNRLYSEFQTVSYHNMEIPEESRDDSIIEAEAMEIIATASR
jgi:hypothetical protein